MTERQFEGRSVAEAAIKACEVLGVTRSALRYKVVSETGELLDRRVIIAVTASSPPADVAAAPAGAAGEDDTSQAPGPARESRQRAPASRDSQRSAPGRGERSEGRSRHGERDRGERGERSERGERNGRGGGRSAQGHDRPRARAQQDDGIEALLRMDAQPGEAIVARPAIEPQSPRAKRAMVVVQDLVRLLKLQLTTHLVADDETEMHLHLSGTDEARMIGKKGEVLLAMQFVVNRIISRGEEEGDQVVVLDAGGYRERRRNALQELAKRLASRAIEERKAVRLSPMSAHDRRVFHMALKEFEGVTTRSEGDGLYRNLLIIPAEFS